MGWTTAGNGFHRKKRNTVIKYECDYGHNITTECSAFQIYPVERRLSTFHQKQYAFITLDLCLPFCRLGQSCAHGRHSLGVCSCVSLCVPCKQRSVFGIQCSTILLHNIMKSCVLLAYMGSPCSGGWGVVLGMVFVFAWLCFRFPYAPGRWVAFWWFDFIHPDFRELLRKKQ